VEHDGKDELVVLDDEAEQEMQKQNIPIEQPEAEILSYSASSSRQASQKDSIVVMKENQSKFMSPKR